MDPEINSEPALTNVRDDIILVMLNSFQHLYMNIPPYLKSHFLIASAVFALLLAILVFLVILPSLAEIRHIRRQVYEERIRLEKLYVRGQLQKKVRANYNRVKESAAWLDNILLKENQELQYITALESAAEKTGVGLKITVGEQSRLSGQPLSVLGFTFNLAGSWPKIVSFLAALENMPYYTNVLEVIAARREQSGPEAAVGATATVTAQTFWLVP